MSTQNSPVSISDSLGNLLFYSDGGYVWSKNNQVMPNGSGLIALISFGQPIYSIKSLANPDQYYIFCIPSYGYAPTYPQGLYSSLLDMQLNAGMGDVVAGMKNIAVPGGEYATSWMSGTRHHNNKDAWLIVRSVNPQAYLSYKITSSGINVPPVISLSTVYPSYDPGEYGGWLKISPDGTRLVTSYYRDSIAEFCNFNDQTGVVTPIFKFCQKYREKKYIPGHESFSADNHFLYLHAYWPFNSVPNFPFALLYQYDATATDSMQFMMSETIIDSSFAPTSYEDLQYGPDLKVYTPLWTKDSVGVIHNPEIYGSGCNFQKNAIGLNGNNVYYGLPQFLQKYKAYLHNTGSDCQVNSLHFSGDIWPPGDTIRWNFGDPASGVANVSYLPTPSHLFTAPGNYTVELYVRHNDNRTDTTWRTITIYPSPTPLLGPDRTICAGNTATFDAGYCSGCSYEWKNLGNGLIVGTNQIFTTGIAANYSVQVTNVNNCSGYDTVQLVTTPVPQVTNTQMTKSICSGESTNISLLSNVPGTMFHWIASLTSGNITGFSADSGLVINQILTNTLPGAGVVNYSVTPKVGSCNGTPVDFTVTVNPGDSAKISISASVNNVCSGTLVILTALPTNPGTSPVYQWKVNGVNAGGNSPVHSYVPANGDQVQCILTSSLTVCISNNPATSNIVAMTVTQGLPASVAIAANPNPFCPGSPVTFTTATMYGGSTPFYQWKVNGANAGINTPTFVYNPSDHDSVRCVMTSNLACVSSNPAVSNKIVLNASPAPHVSFSPCFDTLTTVDAKPFKLRGGLPLGGTYTGAGVNSVSGMFDPPAAGIGVHQVGYSYTNVNGCVSSAIRNVQCVNSVIFTCGGTLTDIRDGKTYPTVQIGTQCWMSSNLEFGMTIDEHTPQTDNCIPERYLRYASPVTRHAFYQWDEVMKYDPTPGSQGLCPPGWHVPTEVEWTILNNFYNGNGKSGRPLQDTVTTGFRALPGGVFYMNSSWSFADFAVLFWTSTPWGASKALSHGLNIYNFSVSLYPASRANAFHIRCIKD